MKKNRIWKMVAGCLSGVLLLTGCGAQASDIAGVDTVSANAPKKSIVCTTYPQYDWVCEILGEKKDQFEVTLLLDNGVDLHSYQPTAMDMVKISTADAFIYVGGESENWVEDALKNNEEIDKAANGIAEDVVFMVIETMLPSGVGETIYLVWQGVKEKTK